MNRIFYLALTLLSCRPKMRQSDRNHYCNITWPSWWRLKLPEHDDVIKWKHFPRYWSFVPEIHRSAANSPHKGQCRGALMFSLICVWINGWVNNGEAGDLRRYRAHYDVTVINSTLFSWLLEGKSSGHRWILLHNHDHAIRITTHLCWKGLLIG